MSWEDEDFERELMGYSEMETVPKEQFEAPLPRTIQRYQQRIQSNNSASIFDADYVLDSPSNASASISTKKDNKSSDEDVGVFKDEKVTYVISGRGRGGRNVVIKPGEPNKVLNGDDEIKQQIRKVAPIGYSNEITEISVKAHKMAKVLEQENSVSPNKSKSSSPVIPKTSLETSNLSLSSPSSSNTKINLIVDSPVLSRQPTPCTTVSDAPSSDYFTSQDHNELSSSSKSNQNGEVSSDESLDENSEASTSSASKTLPYSEASKGAIPKRPVPLSVMLKQSREAHRKKQLEHKKGISNGYSYQTDENELASQRKIQEIIRQDRLELEMRKKRSENSSNSSVSSRDEIPPWRRRSSSPPRFAWGQYDRRREQKRLNIDSMEEFPALK